MRYSKSVAGIAVCAVSILGVGANSALAGEIQGNGIRNVPEHEHPGQSICAYSGQNDEYHEVSADEPRVQSWGQNVKGAATDGGLGQYGGHAGVPGEACRGN